MKKSIIAVTTLITVLLASSQAYSDDRIVAGTLIGAGGGALLGQAIGGNTESTLIGTVIGGAIGLTAGSLHHGDYGSSSVHLNYHSYSPRPYHRVHKQYRHYDHSYRKYHHRPKYKHYRNNHYKYPERRIVIKKVYTYHDGHKARKHVYKDRHHNRYENKGRGHGKRFDSRQHNVRNWKRHRN